MKKSFLTFLLLGLLIIPVFSSAQGLVPCGNGDPSQPGFQPCTLDSFFVLIQNIFTFIVWDISTPLAGLLIVAGGVMLIFSAGNPSYVSTGKNMIYGALIGWFLVWGSYLIIDTVLIAIGFIGT